MQVKMILPALTEALSPFWRPIKYHLFPPLGLATIAAFFAEPLQGAGGVIIPPPGYWAQVHGLACLVIDGPVGVQLPGATERRAFARSVLEPFARQMLAPAGQG